MALRSLSTASSYESILHVCLFLLKLYLVILIDYLIHYFYIIILYLVINSSSADDGRYQLKLNFNVCNIVYIIHLP